MKTSVLKTVVPLTLAACSALGTSAHADIFAPPWYVGEPLSVHAEWEFAEPPSNWNYMEPSVFNAVGDGQHGLYGGFGTHAEVDSPNNWMWTPGDGDGGVTPAPGMGGAYIAFKMQNWVDDYDTKLVRIQITYSGGIAPFVQSVSGGDFVGGAPVDANHFYADFIIHPNPAWEMIVLGVNSGTTLDEVVIDTISLPTPGAIAVLAMATAVVPLRRRR